MDERKSSGFGQLADELARAFEGKKIDKDAVWGAVRNALDPEKMVDSMAEALRLSVKETERVLETFGLEDVVSFARRRRGGEGRNVTINGKPVCADADALAPFPEVFRITGKPDLAAAPVVDEALEAAAASVARRAASDPFTALYRAGVLGYCHEFLRTTARRMDAYVRERFGERGPKYLVTSGIGANEQFSHFMAALNNAALSRRLTWLVVHSPLGLLDLPAGATMDNTLFLEFSRSGVTQETVKTHEYTPRRAHRIVFANKGPLRELAGRDGNLLLPLPDEVSGRYGRNKTPILMAPMHVAGMDVEAYWHVTAKAIDVFDLGDPDSLPYLIAKFLYAYQERDGRNLIYLGTNDGWTRRLAHEFEQYWNEGVNKEGNDYLISTFLGLPRDSHMNLEGVLGNRRTKAGVFLLRTGLRAEPNHPLVRAEIDPINEVHRGLRLGDEETALALANYHRFTEVMPALLIELAGAPRPRHSAVLGQLFADATYVYARLRNLDPGANPEVKAVRDRGDDLLAQAARALRAGQSPWEDLMK
jgi:hypothetical protein